MDFTLYTFGDVEIFRAALTGVAMVFSGDGFFVSDNALGLGSVAAFGLIITLLAMLVHGVMTQKMEIGQFIVLIAIFFVMFVPKFRVQIEDYYGQSGQIAAVDNVPLGIAFPVAAMSTVTKGINDRLTTAYQTVRGSAYSEMTSPLKVMLGLRRAAVGLPNVPKGDRWRRNIIDYSVHCMAGRPQFEQSNWSELTIGTDFSSAFGSIATNGLTLDYELDPLGAPVTCADMRDKIQGLFDAYYSGVGLKTALNSSMPGVVPQSSGSGPSVTQENFEAAFLSVTGAGADVAKNFALMATFNPHFIAGLNCAYDVADKSQLAACVPAATAVNQWAEDAAAAGTFFQRIMFHSMNLTLFMFICLSPVVATVMLMKGIGGLKIAGAYLTYGAWSQSWFIGATIVNFYIQIQLQQELAANNGIVSFTMGMIGPFFAALQDKMALAGDMMASIPLIVMSLMTGSVYGLTAISQRVGGADHYNEKFNSPDGVSGITLHKISDMAAYNPNTGISIRTGLTDPTYSLATSYDSAVQSLDAARVSSAKEVSSSMSSMMQHVTQRAHEIGNGTSIVDAMRHSSSSVDRAAASATHEVMQGMGIKESENVKLANTLVSSASAAISGGIETPIGGAQFRTELQSKLQRDHVLSRDQSQELTDRMTQTLQRDHTNTTAEEKSHAFDQSRTDRSILSTSDSSTAAQQLQTSLRKSASIEQGFQLAASMKEAGAFNMSFKDPASFAYAAQMSGVNFDQYEREMRNTYGDKYVDDGLASATHSVTSWGRGAYLANDPGKVRAAAMFEFASANSAPHALQMVAEASGHKLSLDHTLTPQSHSKLVQPGSIEEPKTSFDLPAAKSAAKSSRSRPHSVGHPVSHGASAGTSDLKYSPPTNDLPEMPGTQAIPGSPRNDLSNKIRTTKPEMGVKESVLGPEFGNFAQGDMKKK